MALTPNLSTVTVSGTYVDLQGNAIAGQIKFTPRTVITDPVADQIIIPSTITVTLDSNGSFSALIPVTDDPSVVPSGFTYTVEEAFSGGRTYDIEVPASTAGGSLNLADINSALPQTGSSTLYVSQQQYNSIDARIDDIEEITTELDDLTASIISAEAAVATALAASQAAQSALSGVNSAVGVLEASAKFPMQMMLAGG